MTAVNLPLRFIRRVCTFVKTNSIQVYLFLQVELERVFFVLLALLYEQEYMDTAEKKNEHLRLSLEYDTIKYSFPEILNYM